MTSITTATATAIAKATATGLVYDTYCLKHAANYAHVESPNRIAVPYQHLSATDLLRQCTLIPSREATDEELLLTHPQEHIDYIRSFTFRVYRDTLEIDSEADSEDYEEIVDKNGKVRWERKMYGDSASIDGDTYANQYSETAARKAIGGLIELGETILKNFYNMHDLPSEEVQPEPTTSTPSVETAFVKQEESSPIVPSEEVKSESITSSSLETSLKPEQSSATESITEQVESIIESMKSKLEITESSKDEVTSSEHECSGNKDSVAAISPTLETSSLATPKDSSRNKVKNGFAMIRPPGHHASICRASGFCLFNNVACAINVWRNRGLLKRAMIVDFDVHHGNGTQDLFETDPDILYLSIHRYDNGQFYPGTGTHLKIGEGRGKGYTINIPLNSKGMGDEEYLIAFKHVVVPIAQQFQPDIIVVSAGFDCALGDPLGGMEVTPKGFAEITQMLMSIPIEKSKTPNSHAEITKETGAARNIPIVFALEGGYNLSQIALSIAACIRTLLGHPLPLPDGKKSAESASDGSNRELEKRRQRRQLFLKDLQEVIRLHSKKWKLSLPPELKEKMYDRKSK